MVLFFYKNQKKLGTPQDVHNGSLTDKKA